MHNIQETPNLIRLRTRLQNRQLFHNDPTQTHTRIPLGDSLLWMRHVTPLSYNTSLPHMGVTRIRILGCNVAK